ncbi:ABC transporter ATP-binding protein [Acidihalobacter prosperus]|uniref:ABC transporter ATP-binding protein n=1 Tax=Acidihalobacter prosperus TaxID=160660 RepID=A0A1A6C541_9GAMM|nr:ATP-binding cassette domain-containing protein [Acidihalobacter prosperus]OBS09678.1 ABC transporter ATP-binding protein [Acidihalobacter prosperus]
MTDTPLIEARGLARYYGSHCAVQGISLELRPGEVLGLLGPNGAGKSTTLSMISGNLAPSAGHIRINGIDLLDDPRGAKRHLGYLPEHPPLYRDLTVDEFLHYAARLHSIPRKAVNEAVDLAKSRTGLEDAGRALIGVLSKGFQQRVGIAQAIVHQPAVIILDEPTVGLDPLQIREIRDLIRELCHEHGVILSTHILAEVQATCHRVMIINRGHTVFTDTLQHLADRRPSTALKVGFASPPDARALAEIEGILAVQALADGRYRIEHAPDRSPAGRIAERAVSQGWGLCELTPERASLEQAFLNTIYHEHDDIEELTA